MELEASEKFFVDGKEHPAFLYFGRGHYLSINGKHSLYLNGVGLINTFRSRKATFERLKQIIENANIAIRVYRVSKYGGKKGKRILFAENKIERVDMTDAKGYMKVFNIDEWQKIALKPT